MENKTTFWKFLKENEIEIPIIQRDYAQGRLGEETLRKNFLADLKKAIDAEDNVEMKLDFVYGSTENDKLSPLDGQQRLTTLWLLHWYIALRAGKLNDDEDNCQTFSKFTYETRISSREFCQNLCIPEHFEKFDGSDIVGFIIKQTWFYSAWKQDPTIQSMLRMLGGTKINNKKGEDIVDGIEELFRDTQQDVFYRYWNLLTKTGKIVFYQLQLKDFGLSDDLYIKMNARGKQLTSFENFKADLIRYIQVSYDEENGAWQSLLDARNGIPIKLDNDWTDIFWKNKSVDNKIDEIYFAFINRFFLNELICQKNDKGSYYFTAKDIEENNLCFKYLYGNKSDDSEIKYDDFAKYEYLSNKIPFNVFDSLQKTLNSFKNEKINDYFPKWVDSKFEFIPKYENDGISTLEQEERVVFAAVCRYFEAGEFDEDSFKQWMRIVWNIVENAGISDVSSMIGVMRLIDELSKHSHTIYSFLAEENKSIQSKAAEEQLAEEIAKAEQIVSCGNDWENKIIKAENYAFFDGAISFLFTNGGGDIGWSKFDVKWANAQKYFDKKGVSKEYRKNALLLRAVLSRIQIDDDLCFNNESDFWSDNVLYDNYSVIDELLTMSKIIINQSCKEKWIKSPKLLEELLDENDNDNQWHIFSNWRGCKVLTTYKRRESGNVNGWKKVIPIDHQRNQLLKNKNIEIGENNCITNCDDFLYGWDVYFKYNNNCFVWYGNPNEKELDVYLMDQKWDYLERTKPTKNKGTDEDEYFCFRVDENVDEDVFIKRLQKLIRDYKKDIK